MKADTIGIVTVLIINLVIAVIYLFYGLFIKNKKGNTDGERDRRKYVLSFIIMVLCPVAGEILLLLSALLHKLIFRKEVDLADVVFSKDRVKSMSRGDDERERNFVPLEEALAVSDKQSLRTLMLNILRGDISQSLSAISQALNSSDTEAAHYAASVLRDELNDFRANVQKLYDEMKESPENSREIAINLMQYLNAYLCQQVFTDMEQKTYIDMMADVAGTLVLIGEDDMTPEFYEWVAMRYLEIKDYESCEHWCKRCWMQYPNELTSYTCQLKLYFEMGDKRKFFSVMDQLKASKVVINKETLELIRTFS